MRFARKGEKLDWLGITPILLRVEPLRSKT